MLQRLGEAGLRVKSSKCQLFRKEMTFLGHAVLGRGIATDPEKIRVVWDWPPPSCFEEVRTLELPWVLLL